MDSDESDSDYDPDEVCGTPIRTIAERIQSAVREACDDDHYVLSGGRLAAAINLVHMGYSSEREWQERWRHAHKIAMARSLRGLGDTVPARIQEWLDSGSRQML